VDDWQGCEVGSFVRPGSVCTACSAAPSSSLRTSLPLERGSPRTSGFVENRGVRAVSSVRLSFLGKWGLSRGGQGGEVKREEFATVPGKWCWPARRYQMAPGGRQPCPSPKKHTRVHIDAIQANGTNGVTAAPGIYRGPWPATRVPPILRLCSKWSSSCCPCVSPRNRLPCVGVACRAQISRGEAGGRRADMIKGNLHETALQLRRLLPCSHVCSCFIFPNKRYHQQRLCFRRPGGGARAGRRTPPEVGPAGDSKPAEGVLQRNERDAPTRAETF
jgi:hypothetical protein